MRARAFGLLTLSLLLLTLAVTGPARAETAVTVRRSEARVDFPRGVTFQLDADSDTGIADLQLQLSTPGRRYGAAIRNLRPAFTPGQHVAASWTWARFGSDLPPGTEISYRWRVTEAAGQETLTDPQSVRVDDGRYQWQEAREGLLTVRWHQGDRRFGDAVLAAATASVTRLREQQGVDLRYPVTIHVYASQNELYQALPGVPTWIGGISVPELDTIMVGFNTSGLAEGERALTHELTHQVIYQMSAHPTLGSQVPTWLNEGLAVVSEGATDRRNRDLLDEAIENDALPTLRNLSAPFSTRATHLAGVAYAASESAVRFLLDQYGAERMRTLLLTLGEGVSANDAALRAYGRSFDALEDGWRAQLGLQPYDRSGDAAVTRAPATGATGTAAVSPARSGPGVVVWLSLALAVVALIGVGGSAWLLRRRAIGRADTR